MSDIRYGLKVASHWTVGETWLPLIASAGDAARRMAAWGVDFVEISIGEQTTAEDLQVAARPAAEAGLGVSVHPYVKQTLAPEAFDPDLTGPPLLALLQAVDAVADLTGSPVPLVYHGGLANLDPHDVPQKLAMLRAHAHAHWLGSQIAEQGFRVQPFCETQVPFARADREHVRIGDTWRSCLQIVGDSGVKICWDLGHSYVSAGYGYHATFPPAEFLDRVGHIHAHDVQRCGNEFRDHCPLDAGEAPWYDYLHLLADRHFNGCVLFELDLLDYDSLGAVEAMFRRSVKLADRALDDGRPCSRPT
ncbi:MAG: hypothetical protein GVY16_03660 [Planctomycetes bacterium]|jgi:sugar phosphate isomerase/epimerase|nr:sugar phosphate isomerase/epimerase [Phycisphaerae bacterium]NBB94816.1 hypothetical protein [Planctomycetota bacterium]